MAQNDSTMKLTITHRALAGLVAPVLPHVDHSGSLPVLGCVKIETVGGYLTATATDRYAVALSRMPVTEDVEFRAVIDQRDLRALLTMFKPRRNVTDDLTLEVTHTPGTLRVEGPGALFSNAVIEYALMDAEYPKLTQIFDRRHGEPSTDGHVNVNPALLAKFQHAAMPNAPIHIDLGDGKRPIFITAGDNFIGALMPVRKVVDGASAEPDWSTVLPATIKGELAEKSA